MIFYQSKLPQQPLSQLVNKQHKQPPKQFSKMYSKRKIVPGDFNLLVFQVRNSVRRTQVLVFPEKSMLVDQISIFQDSPYLRTFQECTVPGMVDISPKSPSSCFQNKETSNQIRHEMQKKTQYNWCIGVTKLHKFRYFISSLAYEKSHSDDTDLFWYILYLYSYKLSSIQRSSSFEIMEYLVGGV